jgi:membrane-associated PAP2 superfamily phosphatase
MRTPIFSWTFFLDMMVPMAILALLAPFTVQIDLQLADYFFDPADQRFSEHPLFTFLYVWGLLPGQVLGIAALVVWLFSYHSNYSERLKPFKIAALTVGLTIAIGAGLITHAIFKEHWKRPRPKQITQFGGSEPFKPFYQPNFTAKGNFKSFPSGHSAMGFCFFAMAIVGRRQRQPVLFASSLFLALLLGCSLSLTRIAQGGHFFSDTLAAACLMWICAAIIDRALNPGPSQPEHLF